mmetsp:Transcript_19466/g.41636  ORF Transcript_19466/g.41636 Transcript_19466/m.41636 type:complete len:138 (-) Transcript_19466:324-737(-)|eukprot:CAMPEP_0172525898 /NCGR_PEP_ID=MMETSP1067-20121228/904_1 /TAXON_ID=265564 ORGANISM="Thalassiosira punctigera, Strain Tpunct2005C2" /NCGR_SAMPLE_ID=MMETSP1067 /ASSEMBLY_ACC=CAM_ASM_000444 /LENGTH=137 /DNA_ID=CAMNT_0013309285 /DNA_START=130 /DNA_END=543 /DNA_ORIENTATION=+
MKNSYIFVLSFLSAAACVSGFISPDARRSKTSLFLTVMDAPLPASSCVVAPVSFNQQESITTSSSINDGIGRFVAQEPSHAIMTSTNVLSLKDRPPPPTAEEIAAKKRTFNLWFWGGGFVAPFLATFYYFGLKFWER